MSKDRIRLTQRTGLKVFAFILVVLTAVLSVLCVIGAGFCFFNDVYSMPKDIFRSVLYEDCCWSVTDEIMQEILHGYSDSAQELLSIYNIDGLYVRSSDFYWQYGDIYSRSATKIDIDWFDYYGDSENQYFFVRILVSEDTVKDDFFRLANIVTDIIYTIRYWVYAVGAASIILMISFFVYLMCASGRRPGSDKPQPGWATKIPFDILCAVFAALLAITYDCMISTYSLASFVIGLLLALVCFIALVAWCMSFALRIKLGSWYKNTVVFFVLNLIYKAVRKLYSGSRKLCTRLPLVWKTALVFLALKACEIIVILLCAAEHSFESLIICWVIESAALFFVVCSVSLMLKKLKHGGKALAMGDLTHQVETEGLIGDFKGHAEALNSIGKGMTLALDQQLRSERMKTELITNVSHDLKTPLTSIISYTDLICREPCENETITQYAAVLLRQSDRLKRLIDDLVEASKASTGNIDVQLEPCEAGVFLTQAAGEYEQKLNEAELKLVVSHPDENISIMADGRRLWRVFDNLMNNICKYAQPGTRVYLSLEQQANKAVITFRNMSREELNLTADEFMARFVQGDASRSSDGNGLGLSIAKSLTELQNGTFDLTVDGDLFKVVLTFPVVQAGS